MAGVIEWIKGNWGMVMSALFFLSEALALIPGIASNSVFQLIFGWLKKEQPPQA